MTDTASPAPREAWDGKVPPEHVGAVAHVLRACDGATHVAVRNGEWWQLTGRPYQCRVNIGGVLEGWSYVSPLYDASRLSAARAEALERAEWVARERGNVANMLQNDNVEREANVVRRDAAYEIATAIRCLSAKDTPDAGEQQ